MYSNNVKKVTTKRTQKNRCDFKRVKSFRKKLRQNKNKNMNKWKKTRVHRMSNLFSWNHGLKLNYFTPFSSLRHFSFLWNKTSKWRGTKIELYNAQTHACNVEKKSNGNSFGTSDNCFQPNTPRAEGMRVPLDVCYKISLLYLLNACICCKVCSILLFFVSPPPPSPPALCS